MSPRKLEGIRLMDGDSQSQKHSGGHLIRLDASNFLNRQGENFTSIELEDYSHYGEFALVPDVTATIPGLTSVDETTPYDDTLSTDDLTTFSAFYPDSSDSNCTEPLSRVVWDDPGLISSLVILISINGLVVAGNVLVIVAVFSSVKLRSVTNLFIASLAVADLLLGVAVLPFSVTVEVFHTWLFGELWCSVWLAVDVWMSTASILNLCVISLDR